MVGLSETHITSHHITFQSPVQAVYERTNERHVLLRKNGLDHAGTPRSIVFLHGWVDGWVDGLICVIRILQGVGSVVFVHGWGRGGVLIARCTLTLGRVGSDG